MIGETLKELFNRTKIELIKEWTENDKAKVLKAPNKERAMSIFALEFYDNIRKNDSEFSKYMYKDFLSHVTSFFDMQIIFTEDYEEALEKSKVEIEKYLAKEPDDVKKVGYDFLKNLSNEEKIKLIAKKIAREEYYKRYNEIHQTGITKKEEIVLSGDALDKDKISLEVVLSMFSGENLISPEFNRSLFQLLNPNQKYIGKLLICPILLWRLYLILWYLENNNFISLSDSSNKGIKKYITLNFLYNEKPIQMKYLSDGIKKACDQPGGGRFDKYVKGIQSVFTKLGLEVNNINCKKDEKLPLKDEI